MSIVNRVECAAEDPDRIHRVEIPRTMSVEICQGSEDVWPFAAWSAWLADLSSWWNECLAILPDTILAHAVRQIGALCNGIGQ